MGNDGNETPFVPTVPIVSIVSFVPIVSTVRNVPIVLFVPAVRIVPIVPNVPFVPCRKNVPVVPFVSGVPDNSPLSLAALTGVSPAPPRGICVHLKVWYTESMKKQSIESIYELLPEGWEEAAKSQKALVRGRNIKTAKELLKLVFLYQTSGESYGLTSAITQISGDQPALNKTAVQKRIVNSRAWLQWMCEHLCLQEGFLTAPPQWLAGYRVCVADASDYARQGSSYADFRLHYMMELFSLNLTEVYFTTAAEGETLTRYTHIREKDLILADRAYATRSGIFHVLDSHADFLLRMRSTSFSLYTATGERYDLTEMLKEHQPGKLIDLVLYIKREQQFVPVRICALGKTEEDVRKSQRQIKKTNHGRKPASDLQKIWSHYVVVVTSHLSPKGSGTVPYEMADRAGFQALQVHLFRRSIHSKKGGGGKSLVLWKTADRYSL